MKSCDLIVTQPNNVFFPLWTKWLIKNSYRFSKIFIAIHQKNIDGYNFSNLIKSLLKPVSNVVFVEDINPMDGSDWRNIAVNKCLELSKSEVVWFAEQDFFIFEAESFFENVETALEGNYGVVGYWQGERLHPACLFAFRTVIDTTRKDFSAAEVDHFYRFTKDLKDVPIFNLESISEQWFHMNGLTSNYTLVELGQKPNYDLGNFIIYNSLSREVIKSFSQQEGLLIFQELCDSALSASSALSFYLDEYV